MRALLSSHPSPLRPGSCCRGLQQTLAWHPARRLWWRPRLGMCAWLCRPTPASLPPSAHPTATSWPRSSSAPSRYVSNLPLTKSPGTVQGAFPQQDKCLAFVQNNQLLGLLAAARLHQMTKVCTGTYWAGCIAKHEQPC